MKKIFVLAFSFFTLSVFAQDTIVPKTDYTPENLASGQETFKTVCAACHSLGKGKLVGPDLMGVSSRLENEWLLSFISSSQTMVNSGDPYAVKVFEENNKIPMPDNAHLGAEKIQDVIYYITDESKKAMEAKAMLPIDSTSNNTEKVVDENVEDAQSLSFFTYLVFVSISLMVLGFLAANIMKSRK